jgi:Protein of unknown function (DUF2934)
LLRSFNAATSSRALYIFSCIALLANWSIFVVKEGHIMPSSNKRIPSHEAIERRAYEIYIETGGIEGNDVANWLAAEEELMARADEAEVAKTPAPDLRPAPMRKSVTAG